MARQDPYKQQKAIYEYWIEPRTLNFITALCAGICGGFTQGSWQSVDVWDCDEGMEFFGKLLFWGDK